MRILGIIPARFASTRFPGKPLADIGGKSMIRRVYEQCIKAKTITKVIVATDDERIAAHVREFGEVIMTAADHPSGTDRCHEVLGRIGEKFDYVINIQGDEPFIDPSQIELVSHLLDGKTELATLAKIIEEEEQVHNPNVVKAVTDKGGFALYFSRNPIPYQRSAGGQEWHGLHQYLKHIGIYAYRADILEKITSLPISPLEKSESLEQLRWLENGYRIKVGLTNLETAGIDTPEDLERAVKNLNK